MYNPYTVGAKVYRGGSSAATQGTVDPMGYIERGLRQNMISQTRSGLAAAALRRQANLPGIRETGIGPVQVKPATNLMYNGLDAGGTGAGTKLPTGHTIPQALSQMNAETRGLRSLISSTPGALEQARQSFPNYDRAANHPLASMAMTATDFLKHPDYLARHGFNRAQGMMDQARQTSNPAAVFNAGVAKLPGNPVLDYMRTQMPGFKAVEPYLVNAAARRLRGR
jgi:hypothetical protein